MWRTRNRDLSLALKMFLENRDLLLRSRCGLQRASGTWGTSAGQSLTPRIRRDPSLCSGCF